jgi:cytochrome c-type biogenesis protein CcmH/NrfF
MLLLNEVTVILWLFGVAIAFAVIGAAVVAVLIKRSHRE